MLLVYTEVNPGGIRVNTFRHLRESTAQALKILGHGLRVPGRCWSFPEFELQAGARGNEWALPNRQTH
jgi:hypothetical protein